MAPDDEITHAWEANADRWSEVVRQGRIASRSAGTDHAIVEAVRAHRPRRVLDVGCGEGWLCRRLRAEAGCNAAGIDGSAGLITRAREADPGGHYAVTRYRELELGAEAPGAPFDLVVCNFALFGDPLAPLFQALARHVRLGGHLLVQTLHPWSACGAAPYRDGWRTEDFSTFGEPGWRPMPWYFRTLASWLGEFRAAGLGVEEIREPLDPVSGRPLSLILSGRHG